MARDGVRVSEADGLGQVLVASRAFEPWECVLAEPPLLSWRNVAGREGLAALLDAFTSAAPEVREKVLRMSHPPLDGDSPRVVERRELAKEHGRALCDMPIDFIHKLLLIADCNAHSFYGDMDLGGGAVAHGVPQSALFLLASKAAHSCAPNAAFTSKAGGALLRYYALRPIAPGEQVTISYLSGSHALTRLERRARLLDTKAFLCACARCSGSDECTALRCCACGGAAAHWEPPEPAEAAQALEGWRCAACGAAQPSGWLLLMNGVLAAHEARLARARSALYSIPVPGGPHEAAQSLRRLVEGAQADLSPCHALASRSLALLAAWAAPRRDKSPHFAALAGWAALRLLSLRECIAAGCAGCAGPASHPRVVLGVSKARAAAESLLAAGGEERARRARALARRYLHSWRCLHGAQDADVVWMAGLAGGDA